MPIKKALTAPKPAVIAVVSTPFIILGLYLSYHAIILFITWTIMAIEWTLMMAGRGIMAIESWFESVYHWFLMLFDPTSPPPPPYHRHRPD